MWPEKTSPKRKLEAGKVQKPSPTKKAKPNGPQSSYQGSVSQVPLGGVLNLNSNVLGGAFKTFNPLNHLNNINPNMTFDLDAALANFSNAGGDQKQEDKPGFLTKMMLSRGGPMQTQENKQEERSPVFEDYDNLVDQFKTKLGELIEGRRQSASRTTQAFFEMSPVKQNIQKIEKATKLVEITEALEQLYILSVSQSSYSKIFSHGHQNVLVVMSFELNKHSSQFWEQNLENHAILSAAHKRREKRQQEAYAKKIAEKTSELESHTQSLEAKQRDNENALGNKQSEIAQIQQELKSARDANQGNVKELEGKEREAVRAQQVLLDTQEELKKNRIQIAAQEEKLKLAQEKFENMKKEREKTAKQLETERKAKEEARLREEKLQSEYDLLNQTLNDQSIRLEEAEQEIHNMSVRLDARHNFSTVTRSSSRVRAGSEPSSFDSNASFISNMDFVGNNRGIKTPTMPFFTSKPPVNQPQANKTQQIVSCEGCREQLIEVTNDEFERMITQLAFYTADNLNIKTLAQQIIFELLKQWVGEVSPTKESYIQVLTQFEKQIQTCDNENFYKMCTTLLQDLNQQTTTNTPISLSIKQQGIMTKVFTNLCFKKGRDYLNMNLEHAKYFQSVSREQKKKLGKNQQMQPE